MVVLSTRACKDDKKGVLESCRLTDPLTTRSPSDGARDHRAACNLHFTASFHGSAVDEDRGFHHSLTGIGARFRSSLAGCI